MIQEYLALGTFIAAMLFAGYSLIKFIAEQIKNSGNNQCSHSCNCKPASHKKLIPGSLGNHPGHFKKVRLK